jgi:hypothetical protein
VKCGNPVSDSDCVAWSLFTDIARTARLGSRDAQWETWIAASDLFGVQQPSWPKQPPALRTLEPLLQLEMLNADTAVQAHAPRIMPKPPNGSLAEVRINRAAFDFIVLGGMWSKQGVMKYASEHDVIFPGDSIEVKAVWKIIDPSEKPAYHWQYRDDNALIGLEGLHVSSKVLPQWLWATWEHADLNNPSTDLFGYPGGGPMSEKLSRMFEEKGLPPEWRHYRLIGSQTGFLTSIGGKTQLGNSAIETINPRTASCIGCHSMSRMTPQGPIRTFADPRPDHCQTAEDYPCDVRGAPEPKWFDNAKQLDFVWSFMRAK